MDTTFAAYYDAVTSTLHLSGAYDPASWATVDTEVDRAYRRSALSLAVDLTRVEGVPPHAVGQLVHLCNCLYPGTLVRVPRTRRVAALHPAA